jgi:hypothetical protein
MQVQFVLFESASGFALFEVIEAEEIASLHDEVCVTRFIAIRHVQL